MLYEDNLCVYAVYDSQHQKNWFWSTARYMLNLSKQEKQNFFKTSLIDSMTWTKIELAQKESDNRLYSTVYNGHLFTSEKFYNQDYKAYVLNLRIEKFLCCY